MTRFFHLLLITLLFSSISAQTVRASGDLVVNSIRIGTNSGGTRVVIDVSHKADFRAFMLQNPTRLVVDLPEFLWKAPISPPPPESLVGTIRNGLLQPGISRIVIDLATQSILKSAFVLPSGPGVSDRIVIDFSRLEGPYDPTKERMFGSLDSKSPRFEPVSATPPPQTLNLPKNYGKMRGDGDRSPLPPPTVKAAKRKKPLIVIDAGHGGDDPGAIGANGSKEKNITLSVAKELARQLEYSGRYRVHLTRSTDIFIKLQDRVRIGREKGADLFISLHADSIDKPGVSGASIYTLSNKASDAQTAKLAARENRADLIAGVDLSHEDKQVANILIDLAMRDTMNQSKFFANTVVKQAQQQNIDLLEKPHRFAGFAVLKAPDVPSVLIEMGFMSNIREVNQLNNAAYRERLAAAILAGIDGYFSKVKNGQK